MNGCPPTILQKALLLTVKWGKNMSVYGEIVYVQVIAKQIPNEEERERFISHNQ